MAEDESSINETSKKKTLIGDVIGGIVLVACLCFAMYSCFATKEDDAPRKEKPEITQQNASRPDWHRAESKAEVARRIKCRLVGELAELGLDASNIVANAKAHPTRLRAGVPEHKRTRWLILSANDEAVIARKYVEECGKKGRFEDNPDQIARIRTIVERLVAVVPEIDAVPAIHILRDDSINAFCLPDGTVLVNTGTLKAIPDDSLLAGILAHELGHAAARHGNEDVTLALIGSVGGVLFEEWLAGVAPILNSGECVSLIRLAYGIGGDVGFHLPRSRLQESEADRLGVRYLARAGFDPAAAERLFEWFEQTAPQRRDLLEALLSTHPLHVDRIAHVREVLSEPDLREMPKESWRGKLKKKADEIDFTKVDPKGAISNATSRLPKIPWRRKSAEK